MSFLCFTRQCECSLVIPSERMITQVNTKTDLPLQVGVKKAPSIPIGCRRWQFLLVACIPSNSGKKRIFMLNVKGFIPTECALCKELGNHLISNLCHSCEAQLSYLKDCCRCCALPLIDYEQRCGHCLRHKPNYDESFCAVTYEAPLSSLIIKMKHGRDLTCLSTLSTIFVQAYRNKEATTYRPDIDVIVPIPLHWSRQLIRGFNQSHSLAYLIARELDIPLAQHLLERIRHTPSQQDLNRSARITNLRGSFFSSSKAKGLNIALFDDVITTGATMESAALTLKKAGAESVFAWSIARTT